MSSGGDPFDAVLRLEEQFIDSGWEEGLKAGEKAGYVEGYALGCEKGFDTGREVGFYKGCALVWRRRLGEEEVAKGTAANDTAVEGSEHSGGSKSGTTRFPFCSIHFLLSVKLPSSIELPLCKLQLEDEGSECAGVAVARDFPGESPGPSAI